MKKLLLVLSFGLLTTLGHAEKLNPAQVQRKATELTRTMTNKYQLNEQEYIKLKAMNIQNISALNEVLAHYQNNPRLANTMALEIELAYHKQLASVFNTKQMKNYLAWQHASKTDFTSFLAE